MQDVTHAAPEDSRPPILEPGRNCWRAEHCERASAIVDAADYYHFARETMLAARQRIMVIGWDFDTRIKLEPQNRENSQTLGDFILALAKDRPDRSIEILKWNFGMWKRLVQPAVLWMLWRWKLTRAIRFCFDGAHPPGCSHHQKILVADDRTAVCGGIDMSTARWDTPEHLDDDPRRVLPNGKPYPPWHDVTMMLSGAAAAALGELGCDRWYRATSDRLEPLPASEEELWPDDLPAQFENIIVGIARTQPEYEGRPEIREIEALYLDMIAAARRFIYIENQYFTSGKIAAAVAERLKESDPPEIVMVMPRSADGWLEQKAMDAARIRLTQMIGKADRLRRFRIYVPVTQRGQDIYVHAKVMIVDDTLLRIGSSNLNNRSLGLDSECDVVIDAAIEQNRHARDAIKELRLRLLAEHLGVSPETFADVHEGHRSLIVAIEALRDEGKTLELLELEETSELEDFLAENELLDPESADGFFEPISERGLKKRWREVSRWRPWKRK
ncbi:MAG: phospholipase D-like domain-containing protein [Candidimonas sp.]